LIWTGSPLAVKNYQFFTRSESGPKYLVFKARSLRANEGFLTGASLKWTERISMSDRGHFQISSTGEITGKVFWVRIHARASRHSLTSGLHVRKMNRPESQASAEC
jgi:hypothetical protein